MKMQPVIRRNRRAYRPMSGLGADLFDTIAQLTNQPVVQPAQPSGWDFGPGNVSYGADQAAQTIPQPSGWDFGPASDSAQLPSVNIVSTKPGNITASPTYVSSNTMDWSGIIKSAITGATSIYGAKTAADTQLEIAKAKAASGQFNPFGVTDVNNPYGSILPYGNVGLTTPGYRLPAPQIIPGLSNDMLMYLGIGAVVLAVLATR